MAKGPGFRNKAVEIIKKFAEEQGTSVFKRKTGETYNPETGAYVPVYSDTPAYMAGDEIMAGLMPVSAPLEYHKDTMVVYLAGDSIADIKPVEGDLVEPAWLTTQHKVLEVKGDMYAALWILFVNRSPEA